jgi:hypothetical protein
MNDVERTINKLDPELKPIAIEFRRIVLKTLPDATEKLAWHQPVFYINGKMAICIMLYDTHLNLGFFNGAKLHSKLLEGTGKGLRHIKVRDTADVKKKEKEIVKVIRECSIKVGNNS